MVRSTLLCRLSRWARRASCRVQRKCIFRKYLRPRCLHNGNIFEKWVPPAKSKEYEASEKSIQNVFWKILTWEILGFWACTGVAKRHFSRKVPKLKNLLKIVCSWCFVCFLIVNGAQHSPLSFVSVGPKGKLPASTQMWFSKILQSQMYTFWKHIWEMSTSSKI